MAKLDGTSEKPNGEEIGKKETVRGNLLLFLIVCLVVLPFIPLVFRDINIPRIVAVVLPTRTPSPTPTPRPTRTPTPTPRPTPTFEEWKESAEKIPYETLFRYAEQNTGKLVYYRGRVIRVREDQGDFQLHVDVTLGDFLLFWGNTVFLRHNKAPVRVLKGDIIAFVGWMNGTVTYESVTDGSVTLPDITVLSLIIESE